MSQKLITVATFDTAPKARLAQTALTDAGIKAVVNDETTTAMDWLLGPAIGGVKVEVAEADADRAVDVLERRFGADGEGFGPPDADELAEQALAAEPAEPELEAPPAHQPPDEPVPPPTERDAYARRLLLAAVGGLVVPPLLFYAFYLLLNAIFGDGPLSADGRRRVVWAAVLMPAGLVEWLSFAVYYRQIMP